MKLIGLTSALLLIGLSCSSGIEQIGEEGSGESGQAPVQMGGDESTGESTGGSTGGAADSDPAAPPPQAGTDCGTDGVLRIGVILPHDASTHVRSRVRLGAVEQAVEDINNAGGVLGTDVEVLTYFDPETPDRTEDTGLPATPNDEAAGLADQGVDVIMSIVRSTDALSVLDVSTAQGLLQVSPNATSTDFRQADAADLFFRTAPSDEIQGRLIADELLAGAHDVVAVVYGGNSYGTSLESSIRLRYVGGTRGYVDFQYEDDNTEWSDLADQVLSSGATGVVVIGNGPDSAEIVRALDGVGIGPSNPAMDIWGVDSNDAIERSLDGDVEILNGFRQTVPSADHSRADVQLLHSGLRSFVDDPTAPVSFAAEAYDAVTIVGLAAVKAGCDASRDVATEMISTTRDGERCQAYADCVGLLDQGRDIDFDGLGGRYEFDESGEPSEAVYRVDTYGPGGAIALSYRAASLCAICRVNDFPEIPFPSGSAELSQEMRSNLNEAAATLLRSESTEKIEIQGFASPDGSPEANLQLSKDRALAVYNYLVDANHTLADRLEPRGCGQTDEFSENRVVVFSEVSSGCELAL